MHKPDINTQKIIQEDNNNTHIRVTRTQIKKEFSSLSFNDLLSKTKINCGKECKGLELIDFEDNSLLARYGFKKGDIIKVINERKISNLKDITMTCNMLAKEIFANENEKDVTVMLTRDGEDVNMNFKIPKFIPKKVHYTMHLDKKVGK